MLLFSEVYLYRSLKYTMKRNLNHHYNVNKNNLKLLTFLNWICFSLLTIMNMISAITGTNLYSIINQSSDERSKNLMKLVLLLYLIGYNLPMYLYFFLNYKNIDFKRYVWEIMQGYKIVWYFDSWSIFIRRSCWTYENEDSSLTLLSDHTSNEETGKSWLAAGQDFDNSDEYMRNFKNKYK